MRSKDRDGEWYIRLMRDRQTETQTSIETQRQGYRYREKREAGTQIKGSRLTEIKAEIELRAHREIHTVTKKAERDNESVIRKGRMIHRVND